MTTVLPDPQVGARGERAPTRASGSGRRRAKRHSWWGVLWVAPAFGIYALFVLVPMIQSLRYSLYDWDGIGAASYVGLDNYRSVFSDSDLSGSLVHAFVLIIFFTLLPILLGLVAAVIVHDVRSRRVGTVARVVLFVPQVVPLVGASIAWTWMYSENGVVNQILRSVGLGSLTRAWLGDFDAALPAVGLIGTWVAFGLCTLLFSAGIGSIDVNLYEAAALDGAGPISRFRHVTVPGLRNEIVVAATVLVIASLASFDIVYISTQGGPGFSTMVPGVEIYRLVFVQQKIGLASALSVVLTLLVLVIVLPLQRFGRNR